MPDEFTTVVPAGHAETRSSRTIEKNAIEPAAMAPRRKDPSSAYERSRTIVSAGESSMQHGSLVRSIGGSHSTGHGFSFLGAGRWWRFRWLDLHLHLGNSVWVAENLGFD